MHATNEKKTQNHICETTHGIKTEKNGHASS